MADRISNLPDSVICYILSFLPTKTSVATSILSKRWKPLWRSVPTFDFECHCGYYDDRDNIKRDILHDNFVDAINAFLRLRDPLQLFGRFRLSYYPFVQKDGRRCHYKNTYELVTATVQHRLEHLELGDCIIPLPSAILSCKTLVVLQLMCPVFQSFSSVHLPSLKILRLYGFCNQKILADLLSGCPNLEDIDLTGGAYIVSHETEEKFKKLHKLIRAKMNKHIIPLEVVSNAQFLRIEWMDTEDEIIKDLIPQFHNLTSIEFGSWGYHRDWPEVLIVLKHCPKLERLVVDQGSREDISYSEEDYDVVFTEYPQCVPGCISSHLKTCVFNSYYGREREFEFARYILQNARVLQNMTIHVDNTPDTYGTVTFKRKKREIRKKLRLCTKLSSICKLLFTDNPIC